MGVIIEAKDIYKGYRASSGIVHAVNGISLTLEKECFYAIMGKSGSGKSTLLHILSGLDKPAGNLDKKTGEETLALLKECSRNFGQTLVVVTHDLEIAKEADIVYKIEDGKLVEGFSL